MPGIPGFQNIVYLCTAHQQSGRQRLKEPSQIERLGANLPIPWFRKAQQYQIRIRAVQRHRISKGLLGGRDDQNNQPSTCITVVSIA